MPTCFSLLSPFGSWSGVQVLFSPGFLLSLRLLMFPYRVSLEWSVYRNANSLPRYLSFEPMPASTLAVSPMEYSRFRFTSITYSLSDFFFSPRNSLVLPYLSYTFTCFTVYAGSMSSITLLSPLKKSLPLSNRLSTYCPLW